MGHPAPGRFSVAPLPLHLAQYIEMHHSAVAEQPKSQVVIRDFPGLVIDSDENDLRPGASQEIVNLTLDDIGVMKSRRGFEVILFEA